MARTPQNIVRVTPKELARQTPTVRVPGLWDRGNERAIYDILPQSVGDCFSDAQFEFPELFEMHEQDLRKRFRELAGREPTTTENQVRMRFWWEYERTRSDEIPRLMSIQEIFRGLCTPEIFYSCIEKPLIAAWIACMPLAYETHLEEMMNYGAYRMREVMNVSPVDPVTGAVNTKLAELQAKLFHAAELRAMGSIPQTVRNLNVNLNDPATMRKTLEAKGTEVLEDKIAQMEALERKRKRDADKNKVEPIDV